MCPRLLVLPQASYMTCSALGTIGIAGGITALQHTAYLRSLTPTVRGLVGTFVNIP